MRLTIERMRTLILLAGALLLAALIGFLAVGKWKNPFNRKDLPSRLGIDIKQEANGFTYTQAHGGHTLFKIHAAKAVQLKDNQAVLHDVKIELYGEDGKRVDRIEGQKFEYDQKTGKAVADGPVEITLMRPGVAPAIAADSKQGAALQNKAKSLTPAAERAAEGEIHVTTDGLSFDQKTGVATTDRHVEFSLAQGNGSSMGATYDSQNGLLVLDHSVVLNTRRGSESVQLHARHAEFERATSICHLREATAEYRDGQATAGDATVLFRPDGSAAKLDASNGFLITTAAGGQLAAPIGSLEFDERNQPRRGHLEGGIKMESVTANRQIHATSPTADLDFNPQGLLRHAHLERGVQMHSDEQNEAPGGTQRASRDWRSPIADIEFRPAAHGRLEPASIHGTGGVVVQGESQRGKGPAEPSQLAADEVTGQFGANSQITALNGTGHASLQETTATGTRQSATGDRLEAHFAVAGTAGSPKTAKGSTAQQVQSAVVEGHVVLVQQQPAKPGEAATAALRATAGRAVYEGEGELLHLTILPRVEDGGVQLTADKIDVSNASGDAFAHGNVKATWTDMAPDKSKKTQGNVALGGQGPAHVVAAEGQLKHATGEATFKGDARLWQQANSVWAPVIVLDRTRQTLLAKSTEATVPVRVVILSASGTDTRGDTSRKTSTPALIRVRGGELNYSDVDRKAVMHGFNGGAVTAETGSAVSVSNVVDLLLLPKDSQAAKGGGGAQVEKMTARGRVVLTSEGRRGTGEQLVYTGATGDYVLTGTSTAPPRMTDAARGAVSGEELIFHSRDDSVTVEGGAHKSTTETRTPK